jgi:hypothetical protein
MSVSSILAFVIAGAAAFKGPRDRAEESPKRKAYKALVAELGEARARVVELEGDVARANVQYRRDQELIDLWRERALGPPVGFGQLQQPAGPDFRPPQIALQQAALQQQAQQSQLAQAQTALQQMANQGQLAQYGNSLLGAQNLIDAELWCNCVPSRSQVWAATDPE